MQKEKIKISKDGFELWFNKPLENIISDNLPETKHIEKLYDIIHFIDINSETEYYKYIKEHFVNNILKKNLFCVLLLNYLLSETDTTFKKKDFNLNLNNERNFYKFKTVLNRQLEIADNIFWGVFELVKNIVNHAKRKVDEKWEETDGNLVIEITKESALRKDKHNKKLWEDYLKNLADKTITTKSFLRISLEDNGERGIIETTLEYMSEESKYRDIPAYIKTQDRNKIMEKIDSCKNNEDEARLLFDMYFSGSNSFLTRQLKHALKGIGLYKFTKFLSQSNGFLNVQTNKYKNKNNTIAFSLFDTLEPRPRLVPSNLFGFSDYHIILPLQKQTSKKQNNKDQESNEKTRTKGRELSNSVYERMLSLERCDLESDGNIFNFEDGFNVEHSEYVIREKGEEADIYVCSFETIKDIDISPLFRSISKLFDADSDKKETIVIRNLSENSIKRLFELYKISGEDNDEPFFFENKILLLFTNEKANGNNENQGIVIAGNNKNECLKINKYINQNNANFDVMSDYMNDSEDEVRHCDIPQYSSLVNGQLIEFDAFEYIDREKTITFFEDKTKKQLEKEIDTDDGIGYNWKDTHLKIGSKLHLRDFVYGKKMFQRSDKASTFAFLLAKDIFKNIKPTIDATFGKKIIYTLVGYGFYSELMVSRTCDFVKRLLENNTDTANKKYSEKADIEYVIVKDEDEIKFSRYFHNLQNRTNTLEKLLIIVPISSTLTTCLKIENAFDNVLKDKLEKDSDKKYKDYKEDDFEIVEPFYTTVVVGDAVELEILTEKLNDKNSTVSSVWERIDIQDKEIITKNRVKNKERRNHYNIYIQSKWQLPYNCEYCFPRVPIQERPIFVTDKVSVTPSLIFDASEWYKKEDEQIEYNEPYFKFEKDKSEEAQNTKLPILEKIHWVHYTGDGNKHFNYYFTYLDFINVKNNESKLTEWIKAIGENFEKDRNKGILLIAPDKDENGRFTHIINREIFADRASVIRFDKHSDHYLNFGKFFKKDIEQAEIIYYVDNLMLSGKTFFSIDEILKTVRQNSNKKNEKNEKKIKGIFSLVNRMDYTCFNAVYEQLQSNNGNDGALHFYSFLQLNVLESTVLPCPLCEERDKYKELLETVSLDCIKEYFFKKEMLYFKKTSKEELLEGDLSYQPFQKKKSSTLLQAAIIHFLNKAVALEEDSPIKCLQKTKLPNWSDSNNYMEYINFKKFVEDFRKFINDQEPKQCCLDENVINDLKFKSNLIKVLSGQFCKKYRGIYITVFYWVLCELIAAARTILGKEHEDKYVGEYDILTRKENLDNLTDFTILTDDASLSTANEIDDFIDKTHYLRLLIKYASSLNIAYLLHSDFLAAINKLVNTKYAKMEQIISEHPLDTLEQGKLFKKYTDNRSVFENFKVFCAAHISRSLYENQQRAIKFEQNINELYKNTTETDKTFLELLLLENTSIIRQTLKKIKNEKELNDSLLDDYRKFNISRIDRNENEMLEKIRLANELQNDLNKDNPNDGKYAENEEEDILKKTAKIVGCNIENGSGILLYKYQNISKEQIGKTENYCVIGKWGSDTSLSDYFEENAEPNSFTANFLEGITYLQESNNNVKYLLTSYALHKEGNEWKGQNGETKRSVGGSEQEYLNFSDIKKLLNVANRILFIRISSYHDEVLQGKPTKKLKGEAVFVFYDNDADIKGHDSVHDTRFIHVLRNDISRYLKNKYDNDTFKACIEERNKTLYAITLKHGLGTYESAINYYLGDVPESENKEYLKTTIDYLLNKTHLAYTASTLSPDDLSDFTLNDIIQEMNNKWLKILSFHHDKFDFYDTDAEVKNHVKLIDNVADTDKQIPFKSKMMFIKEFVFELIYNIRKHIIKHYYDRISVDNNVEITMSYEKDDTGIFCFVCSNNFCDLVSAPSLAKNKNDGLSLINNALENTKIGKLTVKIENDLFKVYIPLKTNSYE